MQCPNCDSHGTKLVRRVQVCKEKYNANLTHCDQCDYLYLQEPYWLEAAYENEFYGDTGYAVRNIELARQSLILFRCWKLINRCGFFPASCDIGSGLGLYARMMRDKGYNFYGADEFAAMQLIKPFIDSGTDYKVKTAFEVIEHLPSLPEFLSEKVGAVDFFLFSTELRETGVIPSNDWWYYAFPIGQHIGFHSQKSLKIAFEQAGYNSDGLMSYGTSIHGMATTKSWRKAFKISSLIWRLDMRMRSYRHHLTSACFSELSYTSSDHLHAISLIRDHSH